LFKKLEILPLHSQYVFSLLLVVVKNFDLYTINQKIHGVTTRYKINLHISMANLTFQKGAYFVVINLFNHLPKTLKNLPNEIKLLKNALNIFVLIHLFYRRVLLLQK
jgi:oligoribonuclease NrnB/cAMP/cGMP phosphodiesterase (DHH superfamily)